VEFFQEVLGVPEGRAREEACRIEHDISLRSVKRLEAFLAFLKAQPGLLDGWPEPSVPPEDDPPRGSGDRPDEGEEPTCIRD